MKNRFRVLCLLFFSSLAFGQTVNEFDEDEFPVYTPFTDEDDIPANFRHYYAIDSMYVDLSDSCDHRTTDCKKATLRYNFEPDGLAEGNGQMDLYYSTEWNDSLAPNGKPLVVLLHGISGNKEADAMVRRAIELTKRGYVAIIPDYTTASGAQFGANPFTLCLDKREVQYPFQLSVRQIRAAIKRSMFLASMPNAPVKVDSSSVFLWGYSYGAITPLHFAYVDDSEWPTGNVTINGNGYTFSESLNDIKICPTGANSCLNSYFNTDYDPLEHIKGISAIAGFITDTTMIEVKDSIPTLLFHGTCDGISPIDAPTSREATYRRALYRNVPFTELNEVSCFDSARYEMEAKIYGSQSIWRRLKNLEDQNPEYSPYRGFIRICGASHNLERYYGISEVGGGRPLENNNDLIEYETYRFFSNILLNDSQNNFAFNLAHDSLPGRNIPLPDESITVANTFSELDAFFCASVPQWEDTPVEDSTRGDSLIYPKGDSARVALSFLSRFLCPSCADDAPEYSNGSVIRYPQFRDNNVDSDRYPPIEFTGCPEEITFHQYFIEFHHSTTRGPKVVRVFTPDGSLLKVIPLRIESAKITKLLINELALPAGSYYLHFDNGEKDMLIVR